MKFTLITDVDEVSLDKCAAWGQYYEPDDIDLLSKHGYDRETVREAIEAIGWSDDYWFPIPAGTPLGTFMFERRKALFRTPSGSELKGYVCNSGHAICLFGGTDRWVINQNLLDLYEEERDNILKDLDLEDSEELFPLEFELEGRYMVFPRHRGEQGADVTPTSHDIA